MPAKKTTPPAENQQSKSEPATAPKKPKSGKVAKSPVKVSTKAAKPTPVKKAAKASKPATKKPATKKKAAPKKPAPPKITDKMFEAWYMQQDHAHFKFLARKWTEANLHIEIPQLDGYDDWLNYFKNLPPAVLKVLASTGMQFLPSDGYAAVSMWHDIISNPQRINKIYHAGLRRKSNGAGSKTILELAQSNDRLGVLKATRDQIAEKLEKGAAARDTAALAREMTEVMTQIAEYEKRQGPKKTTKAARLLKDVDLRRRPGSNGGGSRNTSFKSRVTIKDLEG